MLIVRSRPSLQRCAFYACRTNRRKESVDEREVPRIDDARIRLNLRRGVECTAHVGPIEGCEHVLELLLRLDAEADDRVASFELVLDRGIRLGIFALEAGAVGKLHATLFVDLMELGSAHNLTGLDLRADAQDPGAMAENAQVVRL